MLTPCQPSRPIRRRPASIRRPACRRSKRPASGTLSTPAVILDALSVCCLAISYLQDELLGATGSVKSQADRRKAVCVCAPAGRILDRWLGSWVHPGIVTVVSAPGRMPQPTACLLAIHARVGKKAVAKLTTYAARSPKQSRQSSRTSWEMCYPFLCERGTGIPYPSDLMHNGRSTIVMSSGISVCRHGLRFFRYGVLHCS